MTTMRDRLIRAVKSTYFGQLLRRLFYKLLSSVQTAYWRGVLRRSPQSYIERRYFKLFGKEINLENPTTFAEKIQWLKCNDRDARIVKYADKYLVREFVADTIGQEYLIPLVAAYDRAEDVRYEELPERFVLKPNNSSGRVLICTDKTKLNKKDVFKTLKKWEKENLTHITGEWVYEKIPYKLVCEEFLEDKIVDYKMYFADGEFICTQIITGRSEDRKAFAYMNEKWELLNIRRKGAGVVETAPPKPEKYEDMLRIAQKLAQGFTFIRVDLYYVNGQVYFGELSFYPNNGFVRYETEEMDAFFASKVKLPMASDSATG